MKKKTVFTILQILVTVGVLFLIFHDKHKREDMWSKLQKANILWIFAGAACYGIVEILGAARWQLLLRVQGVNVPFMRLGSLLMIGIFFNQFMPGGTGGDVVKIYYLLKETPNQKGKALLAVLMDRLIGLIGLIIVASVFITLKWSRLNPGNSIPHIDFSWIFSYDKIKSGLTHISMTELLYVFLAILALTLLGIATSFAITGFGLAHKLPARFPKRDIFLDLSVAYNLYARAWKATLGAIILSLCVHIFSFLMFYSAARSLGMVVPLIEFFAVMPIINTIGALPISVGGAGVREYLFQTILPSLWPLSVHASEALGISLLGASMVLFWGLCGGIIYLFYRPSTRGEGDGGDDAGGGGDGRGGGRGHAKLSEIQKEVEKLEHDIAEGK